MAVDIASIIASPSNAPDPVRGSLSDAWQAIVGDRIAAWRLNNAAKLQPKVIAAVKAQGLTLNPARIPERYAFAWFEEATKQDEPEIQELFATLLAKASAGDVDANDRRHIETISKLTPTDAAVFDFIFEHFVGATRVVALNPPAYTLQFREHDLWKALNQSFDRHAWRSVEYLVTLGMLERSYDVTTHSAEHFAASIMAANHRDKDIYLETETSFGVTDSAWSLRRALGRIQA